MPTTTRLVGLESIRMGNVGASGGMGTTLSTIAYTVPDSANLIIDAPETTQLFVEESDDPDVEINKAGVKTIEFATRDMGNETFIAAFGGTSSGTSIWKSSLSAETSKEQSIEVISKSYGGKQLKFEIPRANVKGNATLRFAKTNTGEIGFSCTILTPTDGTSPPIKRTII